MRIKKWARCWGKTMELSSIFLRWKILQHSCTLTRNLVLQLGEGVTVGAESVSKGEGVEFRQLRRV